MHKRKYKCRAWTGNPHEYQAEAYEELTSIGNQPSHWAWISPICGTDFCLNPEHLIAHSPVHLEYPARVCIYCGCHADTKDHLLPRGYTGDARRKFTAVVPACRWCNSNIGALLTWSITERRLIVNEKLRRKNAKDLRTKDFTPAEMREFGPNMQADIKRSLARKRDIEEMLDWPGSDAYDLRALERSGIDNGYDIGLLEPVTDTLIHHVKAVCSKGNPPKWDLLNRRKRPA